MRGGGEGEWVLGVTHVRGRFALRAQAMGFALRVGSHLAPGASARAQRRGLERAAVVPSQERGAGYAPLPTETGKGVVLRKESQGGGDEKMGGVSAQRGRDTRECAEKRLLVL